MDRCVICREEEWDDCFEIQEFINKEQYVFKVRGKPFYFNTINTYQQKGEPLGPNNVVHQRDTVSGHKLDHLAINSTTAVAAEA